MELIRDLYNLRPEHRGCVATIGNFDGVHRGHQAVIRQVASHARQLDVPAVAMIFEPQPLEFFAPEIAPPRLSSLREKVEMLRGSDVDRVVCLRFDAELSRVSAREFVGGILVRGLGVRRVVVGDDFRFGHNREGDFALLRSLGPELGFDVVATETFLLDGERVSSSGVREKLLQGDLAAAAAMLGRGYRLSGRVVRGRQRGRELGFPTANIDLSRRKPPLHGIFAVRVHGLNGAARDAIASVGTRPVFSSGRMLLEVHLFDCNADLYGRRIEVEFLLKLREEQDFASVEHLRRQMEKDADDARAYFRSS